MGEAEVIGFLTHLAVERQVARSTQVQALGALQLLYRDVRTWLKFPGSPPVLVRRRGRTYCWAYA
jgi:hypothetical protein